jgi:peptidoglycan/xylan/chitin deacetylase (PgdA/CDA1 family)
MRWQPGPHRPLAILAIALVVVLLADPASAAPAIVVTHGPRTLRRVALTFDDGWSQGNCRAIAAILRVKRAHATFFLNSPNVARDPGGWRVILAGFEVANHGVTHRDLTTLDDASLAWEIAGAERTIETALGRPMLKVLRPPYGAWDGRVLRVAGRLGYRYILL